MSYSLSFLPKAGDVLKSLEVTGPEGSQHVSLNFDSGKSFCVPYYAEGDLPPTLSGKGMLGCVKCGKLLGIFVNGKPMHDECAPKQLSS